MAALSDIHLSTVLSHHLLFNQTVSETASENMIIIVASILSLLASCDGFSATTPSITTLLENHSSQILSLKTVAEKYDSAPKDDDIFYLRYCIDSTSDEDTISKLKSNLQWREGEGKDICTAAAKAIEEATANGPWNNDPVRDMAPNAEIINKYITPTQCLTTTVNSGDLCYCIRAGKIDDAGLMDAVSLKQMTDFFLYCKEVNARIANSRSVTSDRMVSLLTANDLSGVKLIGGSADFRKALSEASTKANELYPNLAGTTFLLNLPRIMSALVKLFTPLFPDEVRKKLKFERGPLKDVVTLLEISSGEAREKFLEDIDNMME